MNMRMRKKELIQKLEELSRQQAPDGWLHVRDRLTEQQSHNLDQTSASVLTGAAMKRSASHMKKKSAWILSTAASAAVIAAITLSIVFMQPLSAPVKFEAGKTITLSNGSLVIHAVTPNGGKIGMPPDAEYVDLTLEDLTGIFGRPPIPALPEGYKMSAETISAMMFRSGTVFLMNGITFSKDPENPEAAQIMFDLNDQGDLPISDCVFGTGEISVLAGVEMKVGVQTIEGDRGPFDMYMAEFVSSGIGYRIRAVNLTGEEFIAILESVIKG